MDAQLPTVPDHTLVRPIGRGAFGEVWLARNVMGTFRAIKIVSRQSHEDSKLFDREFQGLQQFEPVSRLHPGLTQVLQIGQAADHSYFYYVMELGDDLEPRQEFSPTEYQPRTLGAECRQLRRINAQEAALIGAQLADALDFLHGHGLLHRDIKPSNILFIRGQPKIGDPGLVSRIEATHSQMGTPGYMAPEGPGTIQADIFSLGKLLYVISTGKQPSEFPFLPGEMTQYPDADYLRRLNFVFLKACSYKPGDRYATAADFRRDLLDVHAGGSPVENQRRIQIAKRVGAILAALIVLIGIGFLRARSQARIERARLSQSFSETGLRLLEANDQLGSLAYFSESLNAAPDALDRNERTLRRLSFTWRYAPRLVAQQFLTNALNRIVTRPGHHEAAIATANGSVFLWNWDANTLRFVCTHGDTNTKGGGEAISVAFSPDGNLLASIGSDARIQLSDLGPETVATRSLPLTNLATALAFHPKGDRLAIGTLSGVVQLGLDGTVLTTTSLGNRIGSLSYSPDKQHLLAGGNGEGEANQLHELAVSDGQRVRSVEIGWIYDVGYGPGGRDVVAASGNRAWLNPFATTPPSRLRHTTLVRSAVFDHAVRPSGQRLLTSCFDHSVRLWSVDKDMELLPPIPTETEPAGAEFSSDGEFIVLATIGGLVRAFSLNEKAQTSGVGFATASADGTVLARIDALTNVVIVQSSSRTQRKLFHLEGDKFYPELYVDSSGHRLLVRLNLPQQTGDTSRYAELQVWDVTSGRRLETKPKVPRPLLTSLSPDGKTIELRQPGTVTLWYPGESDKVVPWPEGSPATDRIESYSGSGRFFAVGWKTNVLVIPTASTDSSRQWSVPNPVNAIAHHPVAPWLYVGESPPGFSSSTNFVWDTEKQVRISPSLILGDGCYYGRFSPSGEWLLVADESKQTRLYNTRDWTYASRTMRHPGIITAAGFTADNQLVALQSGDRGGDTPSVRVWDVSTAEPITPLLPTLGIGTPYLLDQGDALLWAESSGPDRTCRWQLWNLKRLEGSMADLSDLALLLSSRRISASGDSSPVRSAELAEVWNRLAARRPEWLRVDGE